MKSYKIIILMLVLLLNVASSISFPITSGIIYVDDNNTFGPWDGSEEHPYRYIQDAIDNASSGDTIFVYNGTYYENIIIDRKLSLIGENIDTTIIDGMERDNTVTILAENITISGFTITNATSGEIKGVFRAGVRVIGSNATIVDNIIIDNTIGVFIRRARNIKVFNNSFYNNGITISPYDIEETHIPIYKEYFVHKIENNTVNGKKIYYLKNQRDIRLPSDVGQLIVFNCSNITVENISFTRCDFSLLMVYTNNCKIRNSSFIDDADIWLMESNDNFFEYNVMSKNFHGITLDYHSTGNIFLYNVFSYNKWMGVMIEEQSNSNIFEKNNFFGNNIRNAFIGDSFGNKWVSNYWDNWVGLKYSSLKSSPKIIFGSPFKNYYFIVIPLGFDWNPSDKPYIICT